MKDELVEVCKTRGEGSAQVIKSFLESHDIPCLLKSNAAPSVFPFTINGMGEYSIMVRPEDAGDAMDLIENQSNFPDDIPDDDNMEDGGEPG